MDRVEHQGPAPLWIRGRADGELQRALDHATIGEQPHAPEGEAWDAVVTDGDDVARLEAWRTADTISFPVSEGAYHLRARVGVRTYSFAREGMRASAYAAPARPRLETLVRLSPTEMRRMLDYAAAATADTLAVIGPHTAHDGPTSARGTLTDNRPPAGERHNCTTWATMAPVGDQGEPLHVLAGMPATWSRDNAGWLSLFLVTRASAERSPLAVFWTDEPLSTAVERRELTWSFNPL